MDQIADQVYKLKQYLSKFPESEQQVQKDLWFYSKDFSEQEVEAIELKLMER